MVRFLLTMDNGSRLVRLFGMVSPRSRRPTRDHPPPYGLPPQYARRKGRVIGSVTSDLRSSGEHLYDCVPGATTPGSLLLKTA